jgi:hypothetical protein
LSLTWALGLDGVARPKTLRFEMIIRLKYLSSLSIQCHYLRDLSCKKLIEKEREEAMNKKEKKTLKKYLFIRKKMIN